MCKSMEWFRKTNDFEIFRSRWGGLQRDIFVPTWRFFALGSHDWTSKILFWGVWWHPPDIFCEGVFCKKVITHPVICDLQNLACNARHQRNAGSTRGWARLTRGWTTQRPAGPPIDVVGVGVVHQGIGSEDSSVQLRLAFFQWSSRRWRGCSNQQTLLFATGKDGHLKHKGSCQMSTALGFFIRCGLKMTKMEQTNQTWTN